MVYNKCIGNKPKITAEIETMASLIETNPYLKDPEKVREMLEQNARASSVMEGARGLKSPGIQPESEIRRSTATRKKSDKAT